MKTHKILTCLIRGSKTYNSTYANSVAFLIHLTDNIFFDTDYLAMDHIKAASLLDSYFDFIYANEICDKSRFLFKQMCWGCQKDSLSQLDHTCVLSKYEQLELHFEEMTQRLDEEDLIMKWNKQVHCLSGISSEFISMFRLKLSCKDWRDTDMKTEVWKNRIKRMICQIWRLERRLV